MPYTIDVIPGQAFIRLSATGELDIRTGHELLSDVAAHCTDNRVDRVLIDVRNTFSDYQPIDLYELARTLNSLFERHDRVAILHRPDEHARATFFVDTASRRGWHVRAFEDPDSANLWLNEIGTP